MVRRDEATPGRPCGRRGALPGRRRTSAHGQAEARGFTLTELLVVVLIMGILAGLGYASLRKYVSSAWSAEALNMVQSIRAAQERWRSEHMMYLDVSSPGASWFPVDPTQSANRRTESPFFFPPGTGHVDNARWLALRPTVTGPVRFGYMVNAGTPAVAMTVPAMGPAVAWPSPAPDNWYVIQAVGDTDWDGTPSFYRASNLSGEVFSHNPGE